MPLWHRSSAQLHPPAAGDQWLHSLGQSGLAFARVATGRLISSWWIGLIARQFLGPKSPARCWKMSYDQVGSDIMIS